jgi:hypothetical protein
MMTKLEKLVDLAIAWLEMQGAGQRLEEGAAEKPAKKSTKKEKTAPEAAAAAAPTQAEASNPTAPEPTEKETYDELTRLAATFIGPNTPGADDRRAKAVKHVTDTYKVDALSKVPHGPQRAQLIGWFKDQLVEKQKAAAAAPSGFGV